MLQHHGGHIIWHGCNVPALLCHGRRAGAVRSTASVQKPLADARSSYETIAEKSSTTLEVKRSKFMATVWPVTSVEQALEAFKAAADPTASHNCWAYKVGDQYRSLDDGEPGGTAGAPILSAITSEGVDGVALLVTRHFGGTKLGAGGLMRAYGAAAREALRDAPRCTVQPQMDVHIEFSAGDIGAVYTTVDRAAAERLSETYSSDASTVVLSVRLPADDADSLISSLADVTSGQIGRAHV